MGKQHPHPTYHGRFVCIITSLKIQQARGKSAPRLRTIYRDYDISEGITSLPIPAQYKFSPRGE